ncbi:MAG: sodium:proton antiporter [Planctomycetes bacterium]|nr:sodium:proton antiporter [Planctomycetota bacterium]
MTARLGVLALFVLLALPGVAAAAKGPLDLPVLSVAPFVLLLLTIAVLPLAAGHFWHKNRNKAIVAAIFAVPTAAWLAWYQAATGQPTIAALGHEMGKYVSFILLLGSLYTVSGGILLAGDLRGRPLTNTTFLGVGAVLANLVGTTGASVLLIRPVLRINRQRRHTAHIATFFIFTVSNLGGLLTPLGDPPLFLGFLNGVPFAWTLSLWPQWLAVNGIVLALFFAWDSIAYRREPAEALARDLRETQPLRLRGRVNLLFLAGIMGGVLLQGVLPAPWGDLVGGLDMLAMASLSLALTPAGLHKENCFTWGPIAEVAILFAAIFVCMVPALQLLARHGNHFGITQPWQFFWLAGGLSAFLDNAPTYLTFTTMAAGSDDFTLLVRGQVAHLDGPLVLAAISCGAVFMGALTYIGNGPNFMVKAICDEAGLRTPSFFGYLARSCLILLPIFVLITFLFFRPG